MILGIQIFAVILEYMYNISQTLQKVYPILICLFYLFCFVREKGISCYDIVNLLQLLLYDSICMCRGDSGK